MPTESELPILETALEKAIRNRDEEAVAALFKGMVYPLRRKLNRKAKALRKDVATALKDGNFTDRIAASKMHSASVLALLATATPGEVTRRREFQELVTWFGLSAPTDTAHRVLDLIRDLEPEWTQVFAECLIENPNNRAWPFVFALVRDGLCEPPEHPNFAAQLFAGISPNWNETITTWQTLAEHHEILCPLIYRAFTLPELDEQVGAWTLEPSLNTWPKDYRNKFPNPEELSWSWVIGQAIERGWLDRERMLDCCLEGMLVTADRSLAKWHTRLFSELIEHPDAPPRAPFAETDRDPGFLPLLGAGTPGVITWTLGQLSAVEKQSALNVTGLLEFLPPVLTGSAKGTVIRAMRLLKRAVHHSEVHRPLACVAVIDALLHENPEVHREVLDFLEAWGDPGDEILQERLADYAPGLSPSVRKEFEPWLGPLGAAMIAEPAAEESADVEEISVIDPSRALEPFADIDDFITRLSFFFQNPNTTDSGEVGRLFAGFCEFIEDRPDDLESRAGALLKLINWDGRGQSIEFSLVSEALASLVRIWLGKRLREINRQNSVFGKSFWVGLIMRPSQKNQNDRILRPSYRIRRSFQFSPKVRGILLEYHSAVCYRIALKRNAIFLSDPTHQGGWIDPAVLVNRAKQSQETEQNLVEIDACTALLRLAPEGREEALGNAADLDGLFGAALRYALGDDSAADDITNESLKTAAARSRDLFGVCEILDSPQPDAREPARFRFSKKPAHDVGSRWSRKVRIPVPASVRLSVNPSITDSDTPLPTALHFACATTRSFPTDVPYVRWLHSLWPANPNAVLANGVSFFIKEQRPNASVWVERPQTALVQMVQNSSAPVGKAALMIQALAMTAGQAGVRSAAADSLIDCLARDRIDPVELGRTIAYLIDFDYAKVNRFLPVLQEVSRVSHHHSAAVTRILSHSISLDRNEPPFRVGQLLEFLVEQRIAHPEAFTLNETATRFLKCLGTKNKAGKLAVRLLKPEPSR